MRLWKQAWARIQIHYLGQHQGCDGEVGDRGWATRVGAGLHRLSESTRKGGSAGITADYGLGLSPQNRNCYLKIFWHH